MKTPKGNLLSRLFLATSLLTLLLFTNPAAVSAARNNDNQVKSIPAARSAPSPLIIPGVPAGSKSPTVDGACDQTEYSGGLFATFTDGPAGKGTGNVYLVHDDTNMYMCISSPAGTYQTRFDSLYLDPTGDGNGYAQQDDFALRLDFNKGKSTFVGNGGANGWQDVSQADNGLWSGAASTGTTDIAEYALPLAKFKLNVCSTIFNLAGYHHWFSGVGDDYGWPSAQYFDQPGTWQPVKLGSSACDQTGNIAYVYRDNTSVATSFYNLLTSAGYTVILIPLGDVLTYDFSKFDLTIIADDTGSLNAWGTPPAATGTAQVNKISLPNKPILGLGEGGYAFFGQSSTLPSPPLSLFIGWPHGWHGPQNILTRAAGFDAAIFGGVSVDPVQDYTDPTNSVGIYLKPSIPTDVTPEALENPLDDHASLIRQGCNMLWGNSGSPLGMTSPDGTQLFLNSVAYMRGVQCPALPPPPTSCSYSIVKSSYPDDGSLVAPGATIRYTLTYNMASLAGCPLTTAKLVDVIPVGTQFVPGSATDGISPGADGVLTWTVSAPATALTKIFKVQVMDTACTGNNIVTNMAKLLPYGATPLSSNSVSHPVDCPPIGLPNTQPVYAEDELKAEPYPLVSGVPTRLSVRVQNLTSSAVPVTVQFQVAPAATPLGVGLAYATVASSSTTLPGSGVAVLTANYIPVSSGNRCFKALVSTPGYAPLATQSCLDLTEDFQPGHTEQPVFVLRNDTSSAQTYDLVVDNTCPGWSASVDPTQITGLAAGDSQDFTLSVTPPNPLTLGSGCHIDVQAWIGGELVGGIRKLDLPPVHLPTNINPPWEEPEITFNPDPPVEGVPGQVCIQIQNPLSSPKVVTINFSVADFGAGIGFTPAAALVGQSIQPGLHTYCAAWTPAAGGTLHRCILATLVQSNALDQHSQHNIDIVHPATGNLSSLAIPFVAGNPGQATRNLSFDFTLVGIDPMWTPTILTPGGDPAPGTIPGGGTVPLVLHFGLTGAARLLQPFVLPLGFSFGSQSRVEVTLLLDGSPESGFSVSLDTVWQYLPIMKR